MHGYKAAAACRPHTPAEGAQLTTPERTRDMASRAAALLLLALVCIEFAAAEVVLDCCKTKTSKFFPLQRIQSYRIQDSGTGCDIDATVFVTKNGRHLCVSHPSEEKWVKKHIDALEKRKQKPAEVQVE